MHKTILFIMTLTLVTVGAGTAGTAQAQTNSAGSTPANETSNGTTSAGRVTAAPGTKTNKIEIKKKKRVTKKSQSTAKSQSRAKRPVLTSRQAMAQRQALARGQKPAARRQLVAQNSNTQTPSAQRLTAPQPYNASPQQQGAIAPYPTYGTGSSLSAPGANSASTVTTNVNNAEAGEKKSTWGLKYRSNNAIMLNALESPNAPQNNLTMDHEIAAWDRVNVDYHINDNVTVDFMPQFYHTWFGNTDRPQNPNIPALQQPYAGYWGETGLGVVDSKLAQFSGGWVLDGYAGYFFPTAEWEQDAGTLGATRTNLGIGRSFGKLDVKWVESLWWYFEQYQTSSVVDNTGLPVQNVEYNLWSLVDLTWNFSKKFYFDFTSGFMNAASYADTNQATARPAVLNDFLILDPEIGYSFTKFFSLAVGLWEEADLRAQTAPYVPFNGNTTNTQAYFMTTMSF